MDFINETCCGFFQPTVLNSSIGCDKFVAVKKTGGGEPLKPEIVTGEEASEPVVDIES
jgi:hypothetical protein